MAHIHQCREDESCCFLQKNQAAIARTQVSLDIIEYVPKCSYLGVILNNRMNWNSHFEVLRARAHRSITDLSPLLGLPFS